MLNPRLLALAPLALAALLLIPAAQADAQSRSSISVGIRTGNVAFGYNSGGFHNHDFDRGHSSFSLGINLGDPYCYRSYYYSPYVYRTYYAEPYYYAPPVYYAPPPVYYPSAVVTGPAVPAPPTYYAPTYSTPAPPPVPAAERPNYVPSPKPGDEVRRIPAGSASSSRSSPTPNPQPLTPAPSSDPWPLLASGQLEASHELFTRAVERDSLDASSKVGLALARAALGDTTGGTLWMRRALTIDPDALRHIRPDEPLRNRLAKIASSYQQQTADEATRADAYFMLGALDTIQGKYNRAAESLRFADKAGDHHDTTQSLRRLIEHELDREPAPK